MPFPTEFPMEAVTTISKNVFAGKITLALAEPAYDLQGYAEKKLIESLGSLPKARGLAASPAAPAKPPKMLSEAEMKAIAEQLQAAARGSKKAMAGASAESLHPLEAAATAIGWDKIFNFCFTLVQGWLLALMPNPFVPKPTK